MKKHNAIYLLSLISVLVLSGCAVRTYKVMKDRVDQDLDVGNQGYLMGQASEDVQSRERKKTRTIQRIEIELPLVRELKNMFKPKPKAKTQGQLFKREDAFVAESYTPEVVEVKAKAETGVKKETIEKYKVQKGDTLQKISKKFYGTTKKWTKIYEANRDIVGGPDKIYPGQVIDIPLESLRETQENLK